MTYRSKIFAGITASCVTAGVLLRHFANEEKKNISDCQLPLIYDPEAIQLYWQQHLVLVLVRLAEIGYKTVPFIGGTIWDNIICYAKSITSDKGYKFTAEEQGKWGENLRELLVALGPAFIKLGQIFSIRPDLLPAPVLFELQKLCDAVPPYSTAEAIALIEEELGEHVSEVFRGLEADSRPVAAASLGQVYRCFLRANPSKGITNEIEVAVKVQRPGMIAAVSLDLYITRSIMLGIESAKAFLMNTGILVHRKQFDVNMLDNFASASYFELDYEHEARNQEVFAEKLRMHSVKKVYIPKVYRRGTSRRVLTTEWIDGIQLAKSSPAVIKELVPVGVECFLVQLLDMGFFHGDPHPGNLLVNKEGHLVLIDFGLCAEVSGPSSKGMATALVHLINSNVPELLNDAIALEFLPETVDRDALLPAFERIFSQGKSARAAAQSAASKKMYQASVRRQQFRAISGELNSVFYEFPFVVPEYFALITRALIVLEGIAVTGDPDFDIFSASYPYARRKAMQMLGSKWTD
jgi:aarF domain-containing kinase